tara:strand:- start:1796 stop:2296 length:501 start_codon:yes stop_codon:yes gene_type:complete
MSLEAVHMTLLLTTLLCSLVVGLLFGFTVVVMPGISKLNDHDFLKAFKQMDGIIQDNQPLFMVVWVGSIFSVLGTLVLGTLQLTGLQLNLLWAAGVLYLLGVQAPTIRFNIPLNNALQGWDLTSMDEAALTEARTAFEAPWNRWNRIRTFYGVVSVSVLLFVLLNL